MGKTLKYILTLVLIYFVYICLNSHVLAGFDYIEINPHTGVPDATIDVTPLEISSMTVVNITAPSGYAGVKIATTTYSKNIEITGTGNTNATNALLIKNSDNSELFKVQDNKETYINNRLYIQGDDGISSGLTADTYDNNAWTQFENICYRSRGIRGSPSILGSNDKVLAWKLYGYDGSNFTQGAELLSRVDGPVSLNIVPMKWEFQTQDSVGDFIARLTIRSSGNVELSNTLSVSTITAPSGVNLTFIDDNAGTLTLSEMSCPPLIYISSASVSEGNINLADATNWDTSKALIKTVELLTAATDYTCVLYSDDGFSTDEVEVMVSGHEDSSIFLDYPYYDVDVSSEVHFKYTDNGGTATATIKMRGYKLR